MKNSIMYINDLLKLPAFNQFDTLDTIGRLIYEAYVCDRKLSVVYDFPNPNLTSEDFKKAIMETVRKEGYQVSVSKSEKIAMTDVIHSIEISWEEYFTINKNQVQDFLLLGKKMVF